MTGKTDFSFSGLKTAISLEVKAIGQEMHQDRNLRAELAFAIQDAIVTCLFEKVELAIRNGGYKTLVVSGGVAANLSLRRRLVFPGVDVFFPTSSHCVDNAAMIAYVGARRLACGQRLKQNSPVFSYWSLG